METLVAALPYLLAPMISVCNAMGWWKWCRRKTTTNSWRNAFRWVPFLP